MSSSPTIARITQSSLSQQSLPRVRFSLTVPGARNGRWLTRWARGAVSVPALGRRRPASSSSRVDLPTPDGPVTTVSPTGRSKDTASSTLPAAPGKPYPTPLPTTRCVSTRRGNGALSDSRSGDSALSCGSGGAEVSSDADEWSSPRTSAS